LIAEEFERLKLGRLTTPLDEPLRDSLDVQHSNHHLGTTRMSDDPGAGVVDANCKFHDLENLYAIGGNIFPTASWANPTFNLLALTLRLAEHLKMASVR
jgi:choline dehydrogenase-like flavoprotein